jgi:hypothetical protein
MFESMTPYLPYYIGVVMTLSVVLRFLRWNKERKKSE